VTGIIIFFKEFVWLCKKVYVTNYRCYSSFLCSREGQYYFS